MYSPRPIRPHMKALAKVSSGIFSDCETGRNKHEHRSVGKDFETACHDRRELCGEVAAA